MKRIIVLIPIFYFVTALQVSANPCKWDKGDWWMMGGFWLATSLEWHQTYQIGEDGQESNAELGRNPTQKEVDVWMIKRIGFVTGTSCALGYFGAPDGAQKLFQSFYLFLHTFAVTQNWQMGYHFRF